MASDQKVKRVVGLRYRKSDALPTLVLKGSGHFAEKIIEESDNLDNSPTTIQNEELTKQLYKMSIDTQIQPEVFEMVATVLAHLYSIEERYKEEQPWMQ